MKILSSLQWQHPSERERATKAKFAEFRSGFVFFVFKKHEMAWNTAIYMHIDRKKPTNNGNNLHKTIFEVNSIRAGISLEKRVGRNRSESRNEIYESILTTVTFWRMTWTQQTENALLADAWEGNANGFQSVSRGLNNWVNERNKNFPIENRQSRNKTNDESSHTTRYRMRVSEREGKSKRLIRYFVIQWYATAAAKCSVDYFNLFIRRLLLFFRLFFFAVHFAPLIILSACTSQACAFVWLGFENWFCFSRV